jgi:hypothetical protein
MFIYFISIQGLITYPRGLTKENPSLLTPQQFFSHFVGDFQVLGGRIEMKKVKNIIEEVSYIQNPNYLRRILFVLNFHI